MNAISAAEERQSSLLPRNPLGARLCEIFPYRWHTITADNTTLPTWTTNTKYPLRPRVLWQTWRDPATLIGVRFGSTTSYALIDIDRESPYHPAQNPDGLKLLLAALETIGIVRSVLLRSSHSGGLHLYLPLPYAVPTFGLAQAIRQSLEAQGIGIVPGQVEIFPNTKGYAVPGSGEYIEYNAHRLPLQPDSGSCLLDGDGNPQGSDLRQFFQQWDCAAEGQDLELLHEAIGVARRNGSKRKRKTISPVEDWRADLQTEINEGWTGQGQTNQLLKTIACYGVVFEGMTGERLAEFIASTAINAPGYEEFCQHQHEIDKRALVWARSAEKYWWALGTDPRRTGTAYGDSGEGSNVVPINKNQLRAEDAKRRIREAVTQLTQAGQLPVDATARLHAIIPLAHTSPQTLYRYPELWHPAHTGSEVPVSADTVQDTAIVREASPDSPESLKPLPDDELHTLESNMKGVGDLDPEMDTLLSGDEVRKAVVIPFKRLGREEKTLNGHPLEKPYPESLNSNETQ